MKVIKKKKKAWRHRLELSLDCLSRCALLDINRFHGKVINKTEMEFIACKSRSSYLKSQQCCCLCKKKMAICHWISVYYRSYVTVQHFVQTLQMHRLFWQVKWQKKRITAESDEESDPKKWGWKQETWREIVYPPSSPSDLAAVGCRRRGGGGWMWTAGRKKNAPETALFVGFSRCGPYGSWRPWGRAAYSPCSPRQNAAQEDRKEAGLFFMNALSVWLTARLKQWNSPVCGGGRGKWWEMCAIMWTHYYWNEE